MNEKKFTNLKQVTAKVLQDDLESRNSNNALYADVLMMMGAPSHIVNSIRELDRLKLPSYESVTRARRKAVEENPALHGKQSVTEERFSLFKFYRELRK